MLSETDTNGYFSKRRFKLMWAGKRLIQIFWSYRVCQHQKVAYRPYRIWVEPTNKCNLACVMCSNKTFAPEEIGFMDFDLFKKIVNEARHFIYDMNIHHRGESTLHPRFPEMIEYAAKNGITVKFHTNGTLLTEDKCRALIEAGLALISFSFDGYNKKSYESIRVNANFEKTLQNIERLYSIKQQLGRKNPKMVMEVMEALEGFEYQPEEKKAFLARLHFLDRLIIKKPHNWGGNVSSDAFNDNDLVACTMPWHSQVILWDGRVGPCPHDFFAKIILGDVREKSLVEIFNNRATRQLRERHLKLALRDYSPCNSCDTPRRRNVLGIPTPSLKYVKE